MNPVPALLAVLHGIAALSEPLHFGLFGDLHIARPGATVRQVALLVSDRPGWAVPEERIAQDLAGSGTLVIGVDLAAYLAELAGVHGRCAYPAGHVEEMVHWVERHEALADYRAPLLIGRGSGADVAYAVAAQAPAGTFAGLVTLGYDFDWRLARPLCAGDAGPVAAAEAGRGYRITPARGFAVDWLPLSSAADGPLTGASPPVRAMLWLADGLGRYLAGSAAAAAAPLPDRIERWQRPRAAAPVAPDVADLPLTEVAPQGTPNGRVAIILTGDGGWAGLDRGVAEVLARQGMRVVGFSTLKFFWKTRTPDEAAAAVARVIDHYTAGAADTRCVLIGYSFGASLVPVVINRLPSAAQARLEAAFAISPDPEAVFEVKVGDWFGGAHHEGAVPIAPEVARLGAAFYCIHGKDEDDSICPKLDAAHTRVLSLPGGHHYDGDYTALGTLIADRLAK